MNLHSHDTTLAVGHIFCSIKLSFFWLILPANADADKLLVTGNMLSEAISVFES